MVGTVWISIKGKVEFDGLTQTFLDKILCDGAFVFMWAAFLYVVRYYQINHKEKSKNKQLSAKATIDGLKIAINRGE